MNPFRTRPLPRIAPAPRFHSSAHFCHSTLCTSDACPHCSLTQRHFPISTTSPFSLIRSSSRRLSPYLTSPLPFFFRANSHHQHPHSPNPFTTSTHHQLPVAMCSGPRPSSRGSPSLSASPPGNKPVDNTLLVNRLAQLIRTEKLDLSALLANRRPIQRLAPHRVATAPVTPVPSPELKDPAVLLPANRCSTAQASGFQASPHIDTPVKPVPSSSPASVVQTAVPAQEPVPIAPPICRRMAARGSHWSFLEKARFEAALHRYGPFAWDRIIEAVGTRTDKQVKAYAARYRRRKRMAARMHALAIQPQLQQPSVVHRMVPEPRQPISKQDHAPPLLQNNGGSVAAPESKELKLESNELKLGPSTNWFEPDVCGTFTDKDSPEDDGSLFSGSLFSNAILGSTGDETDPLSDVPSELDLLVDRAIEGQVVEHDEAKDVVRGVEQGPEYSSDFLNTWFKT